MYKRMRMYTKRMLAAGAAAVFLYIPIDCSAEEQAALPAEPVPVEQPAEPAPAVQPAEPAPAVQPAETAPAPVGTSDSSGSSAVPAAPADSSASEGSQPASVEPAPAASAEPAPAEPSGPDPGAVGTGESSDGPTAQGASGAEDGTSAGNVDSSGKSDAEKTAEAQRAQAIAWYYYSRSSSSAGVSSDKSASKRKIRRVILSDETAQCIKNLDALKKQGKSEDKKESEDRIEMIGDWELSARDERALKRLLKATDQAGCHLGLVMIDIRTGQGIAVNAKRKFYGASSIKGPFLVSLTALYPQSLEKQKKAFTAVAVNSDNGAYSSLVRTYGRRFYDAWREAVGVEAPLTEGDYARLSAEDLARLWLLNYQYFTLNPVYGETLGELFETPNRSAIKPVVGKTCMTRTKGGWIAEKNWTSADAGIVYAGEYPYVLALVSDYPSDLKKLEPYTELLHRIHMDLVGGRTEKKRAREFERE